ncbi:MAG: alanine racemase [Bacteroidota bacterium]
MAKFGETTLEINLSALSHNFQYLKSKIASGTKFMAVVKAGGYGSDMVAIAQKLEALGADYLAVAYTKEGVALREAGITLPILVLHPQPIHFKSLIAHQLEPSLYSKRILEGFVDALKKLEKESYPVQLKFNTGLNRLGFHEEELDWVLNAVQSNPEIKVSYILSHLAASEDENERDFSQNQIDTFLRISEAWKASLGELPGRHMLNTSGIINFSSAQFDMVRSGIGLYGYGNTPEEDKALIPVARLQTVISQIHQVSAGESVGYNRAFISEQPKTTATLPLGHADGISRQYGQGKGYAYIHGQKAPIIGNVCMDMIMVDVTRIDCKEGDPVTFYGPNASADAFAATGDTISYELLTAISNRVTRVVVP